MGAICGEAGRGVLFSESLLLKQRKQRPNPLENIARFWCVLRVCWWLWGPGFGPESAGNGDLQRSREPGKLEKLLRSDGGPVRVVLVPGAPVV